MNQRLTELLLKCYPSEWRREYGGEFAAILLQERFTFGTVCNVLWSALREQARQPGVRFLVFSLAMCGLLFVAASAFAAPMWRFLSEPATVALQNQGIRPPALVSLRPLEALEVVFLGIPLLASGMVGYPGLLLLAWRCLCRKWSVRVRRFYLQFAICSGLVFVAGCVCGLIAWQHGAFAWFLAMDTDARSAPMVSLSHFFVLLSVSTIGLAVALQIPILAFFGWRRLAMRSTDS